RVRARFVEEPERGEAPFLQAALEHGGREAVDDGQDELLASPWQELSSPRSGSLRAGGGEGPRGESRRRARNRGPARGRGPRRRASRAGALHPKDAGTRASSRPSRP